MTEMQQPVNTLQGKEETAQRGKKMNAGSHWIFWEIRQRL
jgi:hypothetical protein